MTNQPALLRFLIMDAYVLIDFMKADHTVFRLIADYIGPIHVVSAVVEEVRQIESEERLRELGLILVEPTMEDAYMAAGMAGPVSFQDNLCMLTAKRHSFTCVTNDKNLRKCCTQERIHLLWGLELLVELHRAGGVLS